MNKFKKILFGLTLFLILVAVVGLCLPGQWKVERSIVIQASPTVIYPFIADFKNGWGQWSAFDYEDPTIQYTYEGPEQGMGAQRRWTSRKMGNGAQKIVSGDPRTGVIFELEMEGAGFVILGKIALDPVGEATRVTWTDSGDVGTNFLYRYTVLFMDRMMGKTFEKSLSALKAKAEAKAGAG